MNAARHPDEPRVLVLWRNDDPSALCRPDHERRVLEMFARHGVPQIVAVIPRVVGDPHDDRSDEYHPLDENPALVSLLREYRDRGLVEIAQHGYTHQTNAHRPSRYRDLAVLPADVTPFPGVDRPWLPYAPARQNEYSEFNGLSRSEQREKIQAGKRVLASTLGGRIESFVFPWNTLNRPGLELLRDAGFRFVLAEDDEHVVEEILVIGCCRWDIDRFADEVASALASRRPALVHLAYHSWMLDESQIRKIDETLGFIAGEPRVTCITPRQISELAPVAPDIFRRRAATVALARRVNRYLQIPHRDGRTHYILDPAYYRRRRAKLTAGLALLRIGLERGLALAAIGVGTSLWLLYRDLATTGRPRGATVLLGAISLLLGSGFWSIWRREARLGAKRWGPIAGAVELMSLRARNSILESARELAVLRLRTRRRKPRPDAREEAVCIIAENTGWGGMEVHTFALIQELLASGFRVEYVSGRTNDFDQRLRTLDAGRVEIIESPLSIFEQNRTARREWQRLLERRASRTLILPLPFVNFGSFSFLRACRRAFERTVYIAHTLPDPMPDSLLDERATIPERSLAWRRERLRRDYRLRCADRVIAVSEEVRDRFIADWGCPPEKIVTIPNGIDVDRFRVSAEARARARADQGIRPEMFVFAMVTRLSAEKGVDIAIEAYRRLLANRPERSTCLLIAGEGPDAAAIRAAAARADLGDRIRFLGFVERPIEILAASDGLLFPSRQEGLPLALLEGMAAGALPIVTRIGGMPAAVGEIGWVVEAENVGAFAAAMAAALALDHQTQAERRHRAVERVASTFDARRTYRAILAAAGIRPPA